MTDDKTFLLSKDDILSGVAKWSVSQSPYDIPDNLEDALQKLSTYLNDEFEVKEEKFPKYLRKTYTDIKTMIHDLIVLVPEIEAWNKPKTGGVFVSRYGQPKPDDDIIDLDALSRNVANDIIRKEFEKPIPEILNGK